MRRRPSQKRQYIVGRVLNVDELSSKPDIPLGRLNEMRRKWLNTVKLVALLVVMFFAFDSCIVLDQMGLRGQGGSYTPPSVLPAFDSVTVSPRINDTVFTLGECNEYLEYVTRLNRGIETTIGPTPRAPRLQIMVHNRSSMDIQFRERNVSVSNVCWSGTFDADARVDVRFGTVSETGGQFESNCVSEYLNVKDNGSPHEGYSLVHAYDSSLLDFPVVNPFYASAVTKIWPGGYWVVVGYHSYPNEKKEPPVWKGLVWSDTVFFRVTE